jgi:hypothetical protein
MRKTDISERELKMFESVRKSGIKRSSLHFSGRNVGFEANHGQAVRSKARTRTFQEEVEESQILKNVKDSGVSNIQTQPCITQHNKEKCSIIGVLRRVIPDAKPILARGYRWRASVEHRQKSRRMYIKTGENDVDDFKWFGSQLNCSGCFIKIR